MSASRYEDIMEAIRLRLQGIVAGVAIVSGGSEVFNYSWPVVRRAQALKSEYLDTSVKTPLCFIVPDRISTQALTSCNTFQKDVSVDLVLAQTFSPSTENPLKAKGPIREELQSLMVHDIEARLGSDPAWNWLADWEVHDLVTASDDRNSEATFIEKWALAIVNLTFSFRYRGEAP